jgi:CheY-like chemotaxis protein
MLERSIDRRIRLRLRLEAESRTVSGDPSQLQSALLNLGINARDAMPEGGELFFETRTVTLEREACARRHYELSPGRYVELRVRDTGHGIAPEVQRRIFEPFFTTKEVGKGTGMGLAAVYGTVRHHRGAIAVTSAPDEGACFTLLLPLTAGRAAEARPEPPDASAVRGARVLVIDDEEILREMAMEMLSTLGCAPHVEPDGASGVAYYREHWREIDLVVLDMVMPRMTGRDAFRALREIHPEARILIASGYSAGEQAEELLATGAAGFVQKPFSQDALVRAMLDALDGGGPPREAPPPS